MNFPLLYNSIKQFSRINSSFTFNSRLKSTIYALSSGLGKCGVSVIRISGPRAKVALSEIAGFTKLPVPRKAELRKIKDSVSKEVIDHGLVIWFPSPKSFTGEDCCEFHVHGSIAVVSALLNTLGKIDGFRPSEPGEFTRRAFYSGKMDLTAVEGLSALIDSETEIQRKHALYQMGGALFSLYSDWSKLLLKCLAHIEAYIDFDEDQNIDENVFENVKQDVNFLIHSIESHLKDGRKGERIREGVQMTILGEPNSGKSSLLNVLSNRPAAIVSSIPGTTRDVVQTHLDLNGFPVNVADTAGLRNNPADQIEVEGISRAIAYAAASDLIVFVLDSTSLSKWSQNNNITLISMEQLKMYFADLVCNLGIEPQVAQCKNLKDFLSFEGYNIGNSQGIIVMNKTDLVPLKEMIQPEILNSDFVCEISCKTEYGIDRLLKKTTNKLEELCGNPKNTLPGFSRPYQRHCIEECLSYLVRYNEMSANHHQIDLNAEELRKAINCLGRLTGAVSAEQLLDIIFKDFCIGK